MTNNNQNKPGSTPSDETKTNLELLKDWLLKSSCRIYTIIRHKSASGKTAYMDVYVINDFHPIRITRHVAEATGFIYSDVYGALEVRVITAAECPSEVVVIALQKVVFDNREAVIPHSL